MECLECWPVSISCPASDRWRRLLHQGIAPQIAESARLRRRTAPHCTHSARKVWPQLPSARPVPGPRAERTTRPLGERDIFSAKVGPCRKRGPGIKGDSGPGTGQLRKIWQPTALQGPWLTWPPCPGAIMTMGMRPCAKCPRTGPLRPNASGDAARHSWKQWSATSSRARARRWMPCSVLQRREPTVLVRMCRFDDGKHGRTRSEAGAWQETSKEAVRRPLASNTN